MTNSYNMLETAAELETNCKWEELHNHCLVWTEKYPYDLNALQGLGDALANLGQYEKAIVIYTKGINIANNDKGEIDKNIFNIAYLYFRLGNAYREANDYLKAIDAYVEAVEREPRSSDIWNNIGLTYINKTPQDIEAAFSAFKNAASSDPENTNSLANLGIVYAMCDREDGVNQIYQMILKLDKQKAEKFLSEAKETLSS